MPTVEEYSRQPAEVSLARLRRAADEIGAAIRGRSEAELVRRPSPSSWAPVEIVCHLRDVEELFQQRFHMIIALEEPEILAFSARPEDLVRWRIGGPIGHPLDPDRWAQERQYLRQDAEVALEAFRRRRGEVLTLLDGLPPDEWRRVGVHPTRGHLTLARWVAALAAHDDNHVAQLARAVEGCA